jgi:DNA-directed RNA polymerase
MNDILRQQFIKLHSEPLLENFKQSLENRFPELEFPQIPQRGEF